MATLIETQVSVRLDLRRTDAGVECWATAVSMTADGTVVRRTALDITPQLSPARVTGIADLLSDVETRAKALWGIT